MSIIGDMLSGIKLATDLLSRQDPRRMEVANLLERIASAVDRVLEGLESGQIPRGAISEFAEYCDNFERVMGREMTPETLARFSALMRAAGMSDERHSRVLLQQRQFAALTGKGLIVQAIEKVLPVSLPNKGLDEVASTAGKLRALAGILRATKGKV